MTIDLLRKITPPEILALIKSCLKDADAINKQTVFKTDALRNVIEYIEITAANENDYSWNPSADLKLSSIQDQILKSLGIVKKVFHEENLIEYLNSNKNNQS